MGSPLLIERRAKVCDGMMEFQAPDDEDSAAMKGTGRDRRTQITLQIKSLPMRYTAADSCVAGMSCGRSNGAGIH